MYLTLNVYRKVDTTIIIRSQCEHLELDNTVIQKNG